VVSRAVHRGLLRLRILQEDVLGLLYRLEEMRPSEIATATLIRRTLGAGPLHLSLALARLRAGSHVRCDGPSCRLTPAGRRAARELVRTHRLWEAFLHQQLPLPADHVHATAEQLEHLTDRRMRQELADATGSATRDPHGKVIPGEE
jgi:manganese/zinc/iron transport system permease protein